MSAESHTPGMSITSAVVQYNSVYFPALLEGMVSRVDNVNNMAAVAVAPTRDVLYRVDTAVSVLRVTYFTYQQPYP